MKKLNLMICALGLSLMTACSTTSVLRNISYTDTGVNAPRQFPVLHATGYASISRQSGATYEIKQMKAMRASKIEAYRELSEQLNGIYITSHSNLNSSNVETSSSVKSEVEGFVHGARVIRQYPMGDTYATELELDSKVVYNLYQMRGAF